MEIMGLPCVGPSEEWSDCITTEDLPFFENAVKSISLEKPHFEVEYRVRHAGENLLSSISNASIAWAW